MNWAGIAREALKAVVAGGFAFFGLLATDSTSSSQLIAVTGLAICGSVAASLGISAYQSRPPR